MKVCVFGTYKNLIGAKRRKAVRLGELLAKSGITVVSGGFGGVMEDVSKGAKQAGGDTIGVTYYRDKSRKGKRANPFIDREIETEDIFSRIEVMMDISDGFIVLEGGTGTLLELAALLEHINKDMMAPKPVVAIGNYWKSALATLKKEEILNLRARKLFDILTCNEIVRIAEDAEGAVRELRRFFRI
ncbi:MAG: LOG family protein [Candidatus Omnitrophica bacterium]|nr:LOG family protein [Candidatus Omnitrophota bacterium]